MIDIREFSFGYKKKKPLFSNLNLSLEAGSVYGLLGRNGAGKSTLLKNIMGLLFPTAGGIVVNGFAPKRRLPSFLETVYFIPEEVHVPSLTIHQYINLFSPFYPRFDKEKCFSYLEQLDVRDAGKLNTLSFGQQKKFIIAFALACNTNTLLLDEPTNGLDIPSKIRFRKLISSVLNEDRLIIISTHQIRDLDNLIDCVIIVDNGTLLLKASIGEIADKLCFKTLRQIGDGDSLLYVEESLKGFSVVQENTSQEESRVNLEHLFNAVTESPDKAKAIFQH